MSYFLELECINKSNVNVNKVLSIWIALLAMFLNQSNIMLGVNISFADFLCVALLIILSMKNRLVLPFLYTIFFLVLSTFVLATSVFIVPNKFSYYPELSRILIDYTKLLVVFVYFIMGYNISKLNMIEKTLKWYSIIGLVIGLVGIVFTIANINLLSEILFFEGVRYRGLLNDPNYFAIVQTSTAVYFIRSKEIKKLYRQSALILIFMSILVSGSKTGIITLILYLIFVQVEHLCSLKFKIKTVIAKLFVLSTFMLIIITNSGLIQNAIEYISSIIPILSRVTYLFTDFNAAISGGGSSRDTTWKAAFEIIKQSPLVGVGLGTYSGIATKLFGRGTIAHNTYLQLFSEWGIPLSTILFSYIFLVIGKATHYLKNNYEINLMLRDIIIIFLVGSLAISLNNARMFWIFLGALVYTINRMKVKNILSK